MATPSSFRYSLPYEPHFERLLDSSAKASFEPDDEIDWEASIPPDKYGLSPEWSSLYGTDTWEGLSEAQRVTLTRHEAASILCAGIWFEQLLQSMLLRAHYSNDYASAEFRYSLTEIADECRHSSMFSKGVEHLGAPFYRPKKLYHELGRGLRIAAPTSLAYGGILAAEEVLDIMQRDWMRDERVADAVRIGSKIHVVEEARHMKFARIELRKDLENMAWPQRRVLALATALTAVTIVDALVSPEVYASVGLDPEETSKIAFKNPHRREMLRLGSKRLMWFFKDVGMLTPEARTLYWRAGML